MKSLCLFSICAGLLAQNAFAQASPAIPPESTPKEVLDLIRAAAEALQNKDVAGFLDRCDSAMPGYQMLDYYLEGLAARDNVISTVEIVSDKRDKDDENRRMLILDWTLNIDSEPLRRAIVKVTVEKQGKKWRFTALDPDPADFFKPPA